MIVGKKMGLSKEEMEKMYQSHPMAKIEKLVKRKTEQMSRLLEQYDKLHDYIKPFIETNKEMRELESSIRTELVIVPITDMVLLTIIQANNLVMMGEMQKVMVNFEVLRKEMGLPEELFPFTSKGEANEHFKDKV
jgi:hypothetical protein